MFYTYILFSERSQRFYIGQCNDIQSRLEYHNRGLVRSTKSHIPWKLVGCLEKEIRSEAAILEKKLKNLNSEDLKKFIKKYFESGYE